MNISGLFSESLIHRALICLLIQWLRYYKQQHITSFISFSPFMSEGPQMKRQDTTFCTTKIFPWANINSLIGQSGGPPLPMGNFDTFGMPSMYVLCTTRKEEFQKRELINKCARYSLLALMLFLFTDIRHAVNAKRRFQESTPVSMTFQI